jgi:hypothetical protein
MASMVAGYRRAVSRNLPAIIRRGVLAVAVVSGAVALPSLALAATPSCSGGAGSGVSLAVDTDGVYNGYWCFDGAPVNQGAPAEGLLTNVRAALPLIDKAPKLDLDDLDYGANDNDGQWDDNHVAYASGFERNFEEFLLALNNPASNNDDWADHGVDMVLISLMGGVSGFGCANDDPVKGRTGWTGWEEADGVTRIKADTRAKLIEIIQVADRRNITIGIQLFYQTFAYYPLNVGSDNAKLIDRVNEAIDDVVSLVDAQREAGHRNVIIELANEITPKYPGTYLDPPGSAPGVVDALNYMQQALTRAGIGRDAAGIALVPVSASKSGGGVPTHTGFRGAVDFYSLHENSESNATLYNRARIYANTARGTSTVEDRPMVITEDNIDNESGDHEGTALALTEDRDGGAGSGGQFAEAIAADVSPDITLFGCEEPGSTPPPYTGTVREYVEGFQTLPINWRPRASALKTAVFTDLAGLT